MDARRIPIRGMAERALAAWRELARTSLEPNPFFSPDCLSPAARHLRRGEELSLLVAEDDGAFRAAMPVGRVARWRRELPLAALSTRAVYTAVGLGTPLVDPGRAAEA